MPRFYPDILFSDCWGSIGDKTFYHRKGRCYYRTKSSSSFPGTAEQLDQACLHHHALEAWRQQEPEVSVSGTSMPWKCPASGRPMPPRRAFQGITFSCPPTTVLPSWGMSMCRHRAGKGISLCLPWLSCVPPFLMVRICCCVSGIKGFSTTNLWYMKQWYRFYTDNRQKLHQLGGEIPIEIAASVHLQPRLRWREVPLPSQASTGAPGPWEECLGFSA